MKNDEKININLDIEKNVKKINKKSPDKKEGLFISGSPSYLYIALLSLLVIIGLFTLLSASSPRSLSKYGNSYELFKKQLIASSMGLALLFISANINYKIYKKKIIFFMIFGVFLILPFVVNLFGYEVNGAKRWVTFLRMSIQPTEFMKICLILFLSAYYANVLEKGKIKSFKYGLLYPIGLVAIPSVLVFIWQNHLSVVLCFILISAAIIITSGVSIKQIIGLFVLAISGIGMYIYKKISVGGTFRFDRIRTFLNPWENTQGSGWQIVQSLYAIGSSGFWGLGIGQSRQKRMYLPESQNDFIFAIFVEEMGYLWSIGLIILFFAFIYSMWKISNRCDDIFGKLVGIGITSYFAVQIIINISVVINLIPVTGMSLPFFSAGGSAILTSYIMAGIMISISRGNNKKIEEKK